MFRIKHGFGVTVFRFPDISLVDTSPYCVTARIHHLWKGDNWQFHELHANTMPLLLQKLMEFKCLSNQQLVKLKIAIHANNNFKKAGSKTCSIAKASLEEKQTSKGKSRSRKTISNGGERDKNSYVFLADTLVKMRA